MNTERRNDMKNYALLAVGLVATFLNRAADAAAFIHQPQACRPPIGATYEMAVGIPVLGRQIFSLHILSDNTAHLLVKGMLFLDEIVAYTVNARGRLNCRLSDHAISRLRRVRASLKEVGYDGETDTPYVKVSTPLPVPVKINLKRKDCTDGAVINEDLRISCDDDDAPLLQ